MDGGDFSVGDEAGRSTTKSASSQVVQGLQVPASDCALEGPDDLTCAVCLGQIPVTDIATVKGCEHCYCVNCILEWTVHKESPWCPQCKQPFSYLHTYRQLDGSLTDYPVEESITLLKRACWFQDFLKEQEKQRCIMPPREPVVERSQGDWVNEYYEDFEDDDPDELEDYYFSSAAGTARVVLGNRRWGENGYMRSGRMYARPVPAAAAPVAKTSKNPRKARNSDVVSASPPTAAAAAAAELSEPRRSQAAGATAAPTPQGRRAKRNAKRGAAGHEARV